MMETCLQEKPKQITGRDAKGRFLKGVSGNPSGRPDHAFIDELIDALENESLRQGYKNFADVVAKRALQYETVLIAVLKKICPDKLQHSGSIEQDRFFREIIAKPDLNRTYASDN